MIPTTTFPVRADFAIHQSDLTNNNNHCPLPSTPHGLRRENLLGLCPGCQSTSVIDRTREVEDQLIKYMVLVLPKSMHHTSPFLIQCYYQLFESESLEFPCNIQLIVFFDISNSFTPILVTLYMFCNYLFYHITNTRFFIHSKKKIIHSQICKTPPQNCRCFISTGRLLVVVVVDIVAVIDK